MRPTPARSSSIFDLHFRKGNLQEGYNVPPITDLFLPSDVVFGVEPLQARHPDEEIVIDTPITQHEPLHWEQLDPEDFDNEFMRTMAQEVTETDRVFLNPDLDAEVTMVEPTDTVQQTVTEILGDVDSRLSGDRAIEKLSKEDLEAIRSALDIAEIFTEPTAKSAPKPKSKPMPKRPPTPPRGRGASRSPAASPRGSVGRIDHSQDIDGVWLGKGDFPETRMKQSDKALEAIGKMMSFMLRGWANDRGVTQLNFDPNDGSVDFTEYYEALSERWNGLAVWKVVEVTSRNRKGRYEIFGSAKDDATRRGLASNLNLLKIRAVQGHSSKVINEDADPFKISVRQYALEQGWTPSFRDLPKPGHCLARRKSLPACPSATSRVLR